MNSQHVKWAAQHDWYIGAKCNNDGTWTVYTSDEDRAGNIEVFTSFKALKAWAGY